MIYDSDVCEALAAYSDTADYSSEQLMPSCEKGLRWVLSRLRYGVDPNNPLVLETATALAHFFFFVHCLAEPDKYENCKVGDTSYKRNITKELEFETRMRNQAIADAASILTDGGFYCRGK